ncbi:uncharacterized protein LOC141598657 [Silene latifolia]|uniref:uncharacterized protein LOC141598657 n=1 Tax=Silene latifolia TaxID=37657 RepID=UPI003D776548
MDDISTNPLGLLLHACSLAKELESVIPNLTANYNNYPQILSQKCDEIIGMFTMAKDHINSQHHREMGAMFGWVDPQPPLAVTGKGKEIVGEGQVEGGGGGSGTSSSTQQKTNKRSSRHEEEGDRRERVRLPAPQIGNLEMPPEDGFTWRKYGQKEILNSKYPRSYYRCTHQKLYNCPAKKQVQRLDDDPFTFEILYRGNHTCHISSTAPMAPLPRRSPPAVQNILFSQQPTTIVDSPIHQWLTMDLHGPSSEGAHTAFNPHVPANVGVDFLHQHTNSLLDLADAMFNSVSSSSSNNMDVIFSTVDDKWKNNDTKD